MEMEEQENKKPSKWGKFFRILSNILTFGIAGMIRQRRAEIHGFNENENVNEDEVEVEAEISPVSGEEIAAEMGGETSHGQAETGEISNEHAENGEEASHGPDENGEERSM